MKFNNFRPLLAVLVLLPLNVFAGGDTDAMHGNPMPVKPNVMILFDTSSSMANDGTLKDSAYNPRTAYDQPGGWVLSRNALYADWDNDGWDIHEDQAWIQTSYIDELVKPTGTDGANELHYGQVTSEGVPDVDGNSDRRDEFNIYGHIADAMFGEGTKPLLVMPRRWYDQARDGRFWYYEGWSWGGIASGNYIRYDLTGGSHQQQKYLTVQEVVSELITAYSDYFNFGVAVYDKNGWDLWDTDGCTIIAPCGSDDLKDQLNLTPNEFAALQVNSVGNDKAYKMSGFAYAIETPIAEAMAEIGRYFAGQKTLSYGKASDALGAIEYKKNTSAPLFTDYHTDNSGVWKGKNSKISSGAKIPGIMDDGGNYVSPIKWRCQPNFVIILTDGVSYFDGDEYVFNLRDYMPVKYASVKQKKTRLDEWDVIDKNGDPIPGIGNSASLENFFLDETTNYLYLADLMPFESETDASGAFSWNDEPVNADKYPDYTTKDEWVCQNIITYVVGLDSNSSRNRNAALAGGGQFSNTANVYDGKDDLYKIFDDALKQMVDQTYSACSPIVPITGTGGGGMKGLFDADYTYISVFDVDDSGVWSGNLKKFELRHNPSNNKLDMYGKNGKPVFNSFNKIVEGENAATSVWSSTPNDSLKIYEGGLGEQILSDTANRKFYTLNNDETGMAAFDYTKTINSHGDLVLGAPQLAGKRLGIDFYSDPDVDRGNEPVAIAELVDFVRGTDKFNPKGTNADYKRDWLLGDILHSMPAVHYLRDGDGKNNKNVIFFGANDGALHCVIDTHNRDAEKAGADKKYDITNDTVAEAWAFVPSAVLPNLKNFPAPWQVEQAIGDVSHQAYVDGTPVVYSTSDSENVVFGLRRGGSSYYSLKFADPKTDTLPNTGPTLNWVINDNILSGDNKLGQSWFEPRLVSIANAGGTSRKVFLMAGGYDTNQDREYPADVDTVGKAVYIVDLDGNLLNEFHTSEMKYSIVSLTSYADSVGAETVDDVIYAPDLGGQLFVIADTKNGGGTKDGQFSVKKVFAAETDDSDGKKGTKYRRKFFYAPGVVQVGGTDYVYIGSGDREHPSEGTDINGKGKTELNRFYCIKNAWKDEVITDSDLKDITDDRLQGSEVDGTSGLLDDDIEDDAEKAYLEDMRAKNGWYINFEGVRWKDSEDNWHGTPEIMLSSPIIYNNIVYFTTYVPQILIVGDDKADLCQAVGNGKTRLWAIDYLTGKAVYNFYQDGKQNNDESTIYNASEGMLTKEDRFIEVGSGMGSGPTIIISQHGVYISVGTKGTTRSLTLDSRIGLTRFYWKQQ